MTVDWRLETDMKVRLWQDIDKLGKRGEIVDVRDGYARNYLMPRRLAAKPSPTLDKEFELEKRRQSKIESKLVGDAKAVAEKLVTVPSVSIEVNTNDEGQLYGSVTPTMIAEALKDHGLKIEPRSVEIKEPIKQTGTYEVAINLHREIRPMLKVWVLSSKAPAEKKVESKE
jgi:large subunit ribosomal protein L9